MCRNYHSAAWQNVQQHHEEATKACLTSWKDQVVDLVVLTSPCVCSDLKLVLRMWQLAMDLPMSMSVMCTLVVVCMAQC
jgi:hypothetical protein